MNAPADFTVADDGGRRTLRLTGALTLARLGDLPARLEQVDPAPAAIDLSGIERMDTVKSAGAFIRAQDGAECRRGQARV
jgi:phospholipid/cholesterol/gamma-HCH transport system permease protein